MELREQSLKIAKQFKSNWVELAEVISSIDSKTLFNEWGYESLEDYCLKELRIKRPTLKKLMNSYNFLRREEPRMLETRSEYENFPQPDVVDVLYRAHQSNNISSDQYNSFKDNLIEHGVNKTTALKNLKEMDESLFEKNDSQRYRQVIGMVRRVGSFLDEFDDIPENYLNVLSDIEKHIQSKVSAEQ